MRISDALAWRLAGLICVAAALMSIPGCSSYIEQQKQQEAEIKAADAALDRDRILVQPDEIALPHEQLGKLEYNEPFAPSANDEAHIEIRLRQMAIEKWHNQVDAITEVKSVLSPDAKELRVTAEAVRIRGECSFCRHSGGYPQGK